jgi:hemerythrin-like domain-containing protein
MRHPTLQIILDEHRALAAMLTSVSLLLAEHRRRGTLPPFDVLRAMLFYLDEFPGRLHHHKESHLLFPLLRQRSATAAAVLDRLDQEHTAGERDIRDLEHALLAFEMLGEGRRAAFEDAMTRYIRHYREHMALEEEQVLPLAAEVLDDADWQQLDSAFAANRDPLLGHAPDNEYERLFHHIVQIAPAPIGLGKAA